MSPGKKPLVTKKASLREHILTNLVPGRRRPKPRFRVYTNEAGERFTVERTYRGQNIKGRNERTYNVNINKQGTGSFATAILDIHKKPYLYHQHPEIYIDDVAISGFHKAPHEKKGRGVFEMVIDECRQLGMKEFGKKTFVITLRANTKETTKYYFSKGFAIIPGSINQMWLKIN
jgi:hypothetical protein